MKLDNKTVIMTILFVIFFCIWSAMAYNDPSLRADYLKLIMGGVTIIVGVALRDLPTPPSPPPPPPEPAPTQPVPPTVAKE